MSRFFSRIYNTGDFPPSWRLSILVTLFKKGNINNPYDYRGISLLDVIEKIYTSIITRRFSNIFMTKSLNRKQVFVKASAPLTTLSFYIL